MIDVKKFVVAFLIIAALASSSALILLNFNPASQKTAVNGPSAGTSVAVRPSNAFVFPSSTGPVIPPDLAGADTPASNAMLADSGNVTSRLANSFLNNLAEANPNGPHDDGNGNQIVTTPTPQSVIDDLSTSSAFESVKVPDWDFEAAMRTTKVSQDSSDAAVTQYATALNSITNNYFVKTNLQGIVAAKNAGTPDNIAYVNTNIQGALDNISSLTVPKNLADFQKGLVKLLVYQKNALALAQNSSGDPAKAALIFQAQNEKYTAAIQSFQNSWENAMQNKAFALAFPEQSRPSGNAAVAFVQNLFGVKTAHAQWVVFDPSVFAQMVWQFVQSTILQILKNTLVTLLQNKVLNLIRNGGNPKFIQGWGTLLYNAFNTAAGSALGQIYPGLCGNFSTDVQGWLQNVYSSANVTPNGFSLNGAVGTNCTLNTAVNNIPGYYNNFNTAGWNGFGALLSPNNNPFGAFAQAYDAVNAVAGSAAGAAQNKGIAAQGYKGQEFCVDGSQPNPGDGNLCDDGSEPFVTTPGTTFADTVGRNLNSSIDLIVNANDITGLLGTIVGALLQQVINSGVNGLLGAGAASTPATTPATVPVACHNSQTFASTSAQVYFSATGGTSQNFNWSAPSGNPGAGTGPSFTTTFFFRGTFTVTVTGQQGNAAQSSNCTITIQ